MCDTLVATGEATADAAVIMAKNSDRDPNEAQPLAYIPRAGHRPGAAVRCTYMQIPQVAETYEVLLSRPFWLWGCEMGANECGVAIGNEAVWTREPYDTGPGLIGMDFIRLALERSATAASALETITGLLGRYGQGGGCGYQRPVYYHNSFIIADRREAWVLETAGRFWAAERVRGVRTISNGLTIGRECDLAAPGLVEHAIEMGWCRSRRDFSFARCYSDPLYARRVSSRRRQQRSTALLQAQAGHITPATMMAALRDHGPRAEGDPAWGPTRSRVQDTICMHAGYGTRRSGQSTGAMVAHLSPGLPTFWLTGTSGTCTGLFKLVYLGGAGLPDLGPSPSGACDPGSLWWAHERLQRAVTRDYPTRLPLYRGERDALEASFLAEAAELGGRCRGMGPAERRELLRACTASCFRRAAEATARWTEAVSSAPVKRRPPRLFALAWEGFDRQASLAG